MKKDTNIYPPRFLWVFPFQRQIWKVINMILLDVSETLFYFIFLDMNKGQLRKTEKDMLFENHIFWFLSWLTWAEEHVVSPGLTA